MKFFKNVWEFALLAASRAPQLSTLKTIPLLFFYGLLLVILAYMTGLASVCSSFDMCPNLQKDVGYLYAVNWTVNSIVILPCLTFLLIEASRSIPRALNAMAESGMLVGAHLEYVHPAIAIRDWEKTYGHASKVFAGLLIVAAIEPLIEWIATSALPLIVGNIDAVPEHEYDWSVAALLRPTMSVFDRLVNAAFSFLVFVVQVAEIAAFAYFIMLTFLFCVFFNERRDVWQIVPVKSTDPRKGFQIFEEPITNLVISAILAFIMFYLSMLQNLYLRTKYPTLGEFIVTDMVPIVKAAGKWVSSFPEFGIRLLAMRPAAEDLRFNPQNWSGGLTTLGSVVVIVLVLIVPVWILRGVAQRGLNSLSPHPALLKALGKMKFWPLSYVSINLYLIMCGFALMSLIFYRMGILVFALLFCVSIIRVLRLATRAAARTK
jgi:hypothetical protein